MTMLLMRFLCASTGFCILVEDQITYALSNWLVQKLARLLTPIPSVNRLRSVQHGTLVFSECKLSLRFEEYYVPHSNIKMYTPAHQVAGHQFENGRIGCLTDNAGRFYKPMQDGYRGAREVAFYEQIQSDARVQPAISFFPRFYGTVMIEGPLGHGLIRHGIMEDLTHGFCNPSIVDLKMGARTWYPEASDECIKKRIKKDNRTTSAALGFKISGMQVYDSQSATTWNPGRAWCKRLGVDGVRSALKQFVSSSPSDDTSLNASLAPSVYGGSRGVLRQLEVLKGWFESQTLYHFASSSILLVYEGNPASSMTNGASCDGSIYADKRVTVKLIDFAHTIYPKSSIDDNVLEGLKSLIDILSGIVGESEKFLKF